MVMTPIDHAVIGGMTGAIEVCLMQPTVAIKNAVQEGRSLPFHPTHLYRGLQMNVLSMAPITATQFGSNFAYNSLFALLTGRTHMQLHERLTTGFLAGATSGLMANPTELVVIKQQQTGQPLLQTVQSVFAKHGFRAFGVGLNATMMREGIYGLCWMEILPALTGVLETNEWIRSNLPNGSSHVMAGVLAGVAGSTLSHPFDTIKTRMQAFVEPEHPMHHRYNSLVKATASIARDDGFAAFFKGLGPRAFRITCAVFILSSGRNEIAPRYERVRDMVFQ